MARQYIIVPLDIWQLEGLSVTERLVASVVYGYTEQGNPCFMTNTGFSKLLRVSPRTISAAVNKLIDGGYIEALEGGNNRRLGWKLASRGGRSHLLGGWKLPSTRNTEHNEDSKNIHNRMNTREDDKRPLHWQQVRDYFLHLDDSEHGRNRQHCIPWARDFFTYYDARGWQNKNGAITAWRPVALAWYRRSEKNVPQRATPRRDDEQLRGDLRWHRRRYENYERNDKPRQAHSELQSIKAIEAELKRRESNA